jgi:hypothetical protein
MNAATAWGYRHPHLSTSVRIAAATWNLIVGVALLAHGYQGWALVEFTVSASILAAAYYFARRHSAARRSGRG